MGAEYRFVDRWYVPGASVEEVYDVIGDQLSYPRWWGDVFLEVEGDSGPPRAGRVARIKARGFLPYRLRFTGETIAAERPRFIRMRLSGDFEGGGQWTFEQAEDGAHATLDWRPVVERPLVRNLTPVLRPLFRANHDWTMRRGREHIAAEVLARRSGKQPVETGA